MNYALKLSIRYVLIPALLAGCVARAPMVWIKPGATAEQFEADKAQCIYQVEAAFATYGSSAPPPYSMGDAIAQGLVGGLDLQRKKLELASMCMRSRGYVESSGQSAPRDESAPEAEERKWPGARR